MKSYTITVNGTAYEVTVEETGSVSAPAAAPKAAPKAAPAAAPKAAAPAAGAGAVEILLQPEKISLADKLQKNADTVELSNTDFFAHAFLSTMNFPSEIEASFE